MRALLLYNPAATTTTPRVRDAIAWRLSAAVDLEVAPTKRRDHASYLAAGAAAEGVDVVVALGGDGTVNEVLQGLAHTATALAIIPGGSTNVWARNLGLPNDAEAATSRLLGLLTARQRRKVTLGVANDRFFGFAAGYGFDAAAVREVERRHALKRTVRQASFLMGGLVALLRTYDRKGASITVAEAGAEPVEGCKAVVCCNSAPFTYLGPWSADLCPDADLDGGLDLLGLTKLSLPVLLRVVHGALSAGGDVGALPAARRWHDADEVVLSSPVKLPLQVDGDYVGEEDRVVLRAAREAVDLVI
ncbi:MAG: diacylglycerol kinase family protein [Egibacteraceae bacterium]